MYRENGRLKVTFYRTNGFPSDGYVRYEGAQSERFYTEGTVNVSSSLNVRSGAGTNYPKIGSVFSGEKVQILGKSGDWLHIEYNTSNGKKRGYVSGKYITF
jgi:uncharacterized protein YgiM (DUF1202 family)